MRDEVFAARYAKIRAVWLIAALGRLQSRRMIRFGVVGAHDRPITLRRRNWNRLWPQFLPNSYGVPQRKYRLLGAPVNVPDFPNSG